MRFFYASDLHGSDVCWRKFLNAGRFYGADVLLLGGDILGKAIAPLEMSGAASGQASFLGRDYRFESEEELEALEKAIRDQGFYPYRAQPDELEDLIRDDDRRLLLFEVVARRELQRWLAIAREKHEPGTAVLVMAGNDDPWFVDEELAGSDVVSLCDDRVLGLDGIELLSLGYSNITPWHSPRELDEDALLARIEGLCEALSDPTTAIFNLHVPPYDSGLDEAALLDETLRPITRMGQVVSGPVGSVAVRQAIERYQPLVSLHGHIHEARGMSRIGRTVAINPGSEYSSGRIHGALVEIKSGRLKRHQLVSG